MLKAIGYVRRSTDRQEESLDQQQAKLRAFAKSQQWELVHVYADDAISGSEMTRPGLSALLDRAENDKSIEAVLTWDRNRLSRPKDPIDGMLLERRLIASGKRLMYVGNGSEADRSFSSSLVSFIENHENGNYLRRLSRDTARGIIAKVKRGLWPGGPIPFGYDRLILNADGQPNRILRLQNDGSLRVIDAGDGRIIEVMPKGLGYRKQPHEQCTLIPSEDSRVRAVQKMFADYAAGIPSRRIRDGLNESGFRTTFCRTFSIPSVNVILESAAYLGKSVYNKRTESKFHRIIDGASVDRHDEGFEYRPEADWIVTENAWPAIIDPDTFDRVQKRRQCSKARDKQVSGNAIHTDNLLIGLCKCGVCGGPMVAQTTTSGKGLRNRYYICGTHHRGDKVVCPKRYTVPADIVEQHIIGLIRADLERLADDHRMHQFMAEELRRVRGVRHDGYENLQHRLAELDQLSARIRDHLFAMDHDTAKDMGLYDQAKTLREERQKVEQDLAKCMSELPPMPSMEEIQASAQAGCRRLKRVLAHGTVEEKRQMIALYVHGIVADPEKERIAISLYPAAFNREIGVTGFEPATSCSQSKRSTKLSYTPQTPAIVRPTPCLR